MWLGEFRRTSVTSAHSADVFVETVVCGVNGVRGVALQALHELHGRPVDASSDLREGEHV